MKIIVLLCRQRQKKLIDEGEQQHNCVGSYDLPTEGALPTWTFEF